MNGCISSQNLPKSPGQAFSHSAKEPSVAGAQSKSGKKSNGGRWTDDEQKLFLEAYALYGKDWKKIQNYVGTRTSTQARSHAQKYFTKLKKVQSRVLQVAPSASSEDNEPRKILAANVPDSPSKTMASAPFVSPMMEERDPKKPREVKVMRFLCYTEGVDCVTALPQKVKLMSPSSFQLPPPCVPPFCTGRNQEDLRFEPHFSRGVPRVPTKDPLVSDPAPENNSVVETSAQQEPGFRDFGRELFEEEPAKPSGVTIIELDAGFSGGFGDYNAPETPVVPDGKMLL